MKYLQAFLARSGQKNLDPPAVTAYRTYETPPATADAPPATLPFPAPRPELAPYRRPPELSTWPDARRERWGRLAEKLELAGTPWPQSEIEAFATVLAETEG